MKNRNELIGHFMRCIEYDDKNNIVDELKKIYNLSHSIYKSTEKNIKNLVPFEDFDKYDNATIDLMTVIACNAFILGYEQCKRDFIENIENSENSAKKISPL